VIFSLEQTLAGILNKRKTVCRVAQGFFLRGFFIFTLLA
jgi:hypothetical protein